MFVHANPFPIQSKHFISKSVGRVAQWNAGTYLLVIRFNFTVTCSMASNLSFGCLILTSPWNDRACFSPSSFNVDAPPSVRKERAPTVVLFLSETQTRFAPVNMHRHASPWLVFISGRIPPTLLCFAGRSVFLLVRFSVRLYLDYSSFRYLLWIV